MPSFPSSRMCLWHLSRRSWPLSIRPYRSGVKLSAYVSSRAYIDLNRRFIDAIGHLDEIIGRGRSLSDSRQWCPSPAWLSQSRPSHSLDRIYRIGLDRHFLIGRCWLNVFRYVAKPAVLLLWCEYLLLSKLSLYYHRKLIIYDWCSIIWVI